MGRARRSNSNSRIHHIYNRGVAQQIIFEDDGDRIDFLSRLETVTKAQGVDILAWCLMNNHYHLLLRGDIEAISLAVATLQGGYVRRFNRVHGRIGPLFGGRYGSRAVDTDEYFKAVVRYVHANPREAGLAAGMSYRWSSYDEFGAGEGLCDVGYVLSVFSGIERFEAFHAQQRDDAGFLGEPEMKPRRRAPVSDDEALAVANDVLGEDGVFHVAALAKEGRDRALALLRGCGLSIRQIRLLTGASVGVISRAGRLEL